MQLTIRYIFSLLAGVGLIAALHSHGKLIRPEWLKYLLWIVPPLLCLAWYKRSDGSTREEGSAKPGTGPGIALLIIASLALFSSYIDHKWFYMLKWTGPSSTMSGLFGFGVVRFVFLTCIGIPLMLTSVRTRSKILLGIFLFIQGSCIYELWHFTGGEPVYRDDHSAFMFRLNEFAATFPQLISYNPYWNGGVAGHFGTASGVSSLALPIWPLLKIYPAHEIYTLALTLLYLIGVPWIMALSIRIMGGRWTAAFAAGIFGLGVSRYFFLWMLHYGTVAANFASPFIVLVAACLYRVFYLDKCEKWLGILLILSVFFLVAWPAGVIILTGLGLSLLIAVPRLTKKKTLFLGVCAIAFLALYAKSLLVILLHSSTFENAVVGVVASANETKSFTITREILSKGGHHLVTHLREAHPLLLFLGLLGTFVYPSKRIRRWFAPLIITLVLITGWGKYYFPDLQLRRMSIPLMYAAIPPAAFWCARILSTRGAYLSVVRSALLAILLLGGLSVASIYRNENLAPYATMRPDIKNMVTWIKENTPEDGRILFAGATRHKYSHAHVASLALFAEREMMACDYYSFSTKEVEYEYPPRAFRNKDGGLMTFFELYNVTHVITFYDHWHRHFREMSDEYEQVMAIENKNIAIYRVNRPSSSLLVGSGTAEATFNEIVTHIDDPTTDAVLKYNWDERFTVKPPAELFPYEADEDVTLIGIRPNGEKDLTLRFKSWL